MVFLFFITSARWIMAAMGFCYKTVLLSFVWKLNPWRSKSQHLSRFPPRPILLDKTKDLDVLVLNPAADYSHTACFLLIHTFGCWVTFPHLPPAGVPRPPLPALNVTAELQQHPDGPLTPPLLTGSSEEKGHDRRWDSGWEKENTPTLLRSGSVPQREP